MAALFENTQSERLVILNYPQAKYYAVVTLAELGPMMESEPDLGQRIIMNVTKREFYKIAQSDQYNIFPGGKDGHAS